MAGSRRIVWHRTALLTLVLAGGSWMATSARAADESSGETAEQKYVISIERIWDLAGHSAFTDIIEFRDYLYCSFREGSGHIPGLNGVVRVIRSQDGANWESVACLDERHVDLRDPKLSLTPDGRLMINCGASYYHGSQRLRIESRVAFSSSDGASFGPPVKVVFPPEMITGGDWLWRVTWHAGVAWSCVTQAPRDGERGVRLVRSDDGIHYQEVAKLDVEGANETTVRFLPDETMVAMIRREAKPPVGYIGTARPPYREWTFKPSNKRYGGPNFVRLPGGAWLAGSRNYTPSAQTQLWWLEVESGQFRDLLTLPSGGDNSYPGFAIDEPNNRIYVSYYSSHEGKAAIYLATLRLDALEEAAGVPSR
ncbi:MAG: sialidase family protein [Pirellulales bacterium]